MERCCESMLMSPRDRALGAAFSRLRLRPDSFVVDPLTVSGRRTILTAPGGAPRGQRIQMADVGVGTRFPKSSAGRGRRLEKRGSPSANPVPVRNKFPGCDVGGGSSGTADDRPAGGSGSSSGVRRSQRACKPHAPPSGCSPVPAGLISDDFLRNRHLGRAGWVCVQERTLGVCEAEQVGACFTSRSPGHACRAWRRRRARSSWRNRCRASASGSPPSPDAHGAARARASQDRAVRGSGSGIRPDPP
jgi:hypothetical protein